MEKDIKIIVATHKKYQMPKEDIYLPIHVGKEGKEEIGFIGDNTGDNISKKNLYYCELTGIYWAWKNLNNDYIGLVHYRRYFTCKKMKNRKNKFEDICKKEEIERKLEKVDVILPRKRNYYIETIYSHYEHTMHVETLDETRKIIQEKYPEYISDFDKVMKSRSAHMFNMFIMKKDLLNQYCSWLFAILEELEKRIPPTNYDGFHARYLGRISEMLLNVWINKNQIIYEEIPFMSMEKIHWGKKIKSFLLAKFTHKKYEKSF